MRWWMAVGNNLYFEVCLFYMEFEISFHLCSIFYGSISNYMASKYKITSCIYIFLYRNFCLFAQKCYIRNQFLNVKVNIITASFDANKWQHLWFGRNNFNILTTRYALSPIKYIWRVTMAEIKLLYNCRKTSNTSLDLYICNLLPLWNKFIIPAKNACWIIFQIDQIYSKTGMVISSNISKTYSRYRNILKN